MKTKVQVIPLKVLGGESRVGLAVVTESGVFFSCPLIVRGENFSFGHLEDGLCTYGGAETQRYNTEPHQQCQNVLYI